MQFIDLNKQQARIERSLKDRINAVLSHGKYIMGPEVSELEEKLADFTKAKYCVSCSSGTDALLMSLMSLNIGPGDAVFTSPFTFIATAEVISLLGATPVFVDIDPDTYNIDPTKLNEAVENLNKGKKASPGTPDNLKVKGVIPVDLFGLPADYDAIDEICQRQGLVVIEDAAQSFGGTYKGKAVGNLGMVSATSFFPAKPLGCYGDGGALFTDDESIKQQLLSIRVHGKGSDKYDNIRIGLNARIDTLQAAILLAKLEIFPDEVQRRQEVAERYTQALKNKVKTPVIPKDSLSAWAQYSILSDDREGLMTSLKEAGIPSAVYYPKPLHLQQAFSYLQYPEGSCPVSESVSKQICSLPMHPYLEKEDQELIITAVNQS